VISIQAKAGISPMNKIYLVFLFSVQWFFAQSGNDSVAVPNRLPEIVISHLHLNDSLLRAPASVGILSSKDLQRNNLTDITPAINQLSGVLMQSGAFNTNRISIRGIGARTPFGTNKIRAFYGNIPLTSGDSETTIEDLNIETLGQAEIIKGPLSSLYGAGLGGAILLTPEIRNKEGNTAAISTVYGSYGLAKTSADYSLDTQSASLNFNYHKLDADGWRQNSAYHREGETVAGELFRRKNSKLTYLANYTYLKAYIPSSINKEMFDENPRAAAATWLASKGFEQYKSYLAGLGYEFPVSGKIKNETSVFINAKKSNEPRPFDILRQNTFAYGLRTQFSGEFGLFKKKSNFIVGAEYFSDRFKGRTYENLYQDNNGNGSLQGNRLSEAKQHQNFYNAFAQLRIAVAKKFEIQSGININKTKFRLENTFPEQSLSDENYSYDAIFSPQVSLLFKPNPIQTIYFSASRGFSLPSVEETLTANGTINSDIKPESGYNFELGGKSYFLDRQLYAEIALYRMQIKDLLVAKRIDDDQYIGVNAGETLHQGVEAELHYNISVLKKWFISGYASAAVGKYTFEDFNDSGNDFSGNRLTGVPDSKINVGMALSIKSGWYFSADFLFVDKIPIDDANTVYSDSYRVANLKTGWRLDLLKHLHSHFCFGVNNIFNEHYASMVLVNATAAPNAFPRYYYPGMPVNFYANFSFAYDF
jgi:iron complex outermembrane receptor protein